MRVLMTNDFVFIGLQILLLHKVCFYRFEIKSKISNASGIPNISFSHITVHCLSIILESKQRSRGRDMRDKLHWFTPNSQS